MRMRLVGVGRIPEELPLVEGELEVVGHTLESQFALHVAGVGTQADRHPGHLDLVRPEVEDIARFPSRCAAEPFRSP